jgi:hypothetical protein
MLSRQTVFELLLDGFAPAWHRFPGAEPELVSLLEAFLARPDLADPVFYRAEIAATWMLDRLLAGEEMPIFERLLNRWSDLARAVALYAWGRRLRGSSRERLLSVSFGSGWPDGIAAEAAWCESAPRDDPAALLGWWSALASRGHEPTDGTLVVKEYARRTPDRLARRQRLLELAAEGNAETLWDAPGRPAGGHLWGGVREALVQVAIDLAGQFVPSMEPLPADEKILDWFYTTLNEGGYHDVVTVCKEAAVLQKGRFSVKRLASLFWVERADWRRLVESLDEIEERHPYAALQRLGKCVPKENLGAWDRALAMRDRGNVAIAEFCAWLRPDLRDALERWFDDDDAARAACAYHAWLARAPRIHLEHVFARERSTQRTWQRIALDRFLYAPPPLRPPATVEDTQTVEADIRLIDPLNRRKF